MEEKMGESLPLDIVIRVTLVVADMHHADEVLTSFVEDVIGKPPQVCPPKTAFAWREPKRVSCGVR
jgi:hypothetical protein